MNIYEHELAYTNGFRPDHIRMADTSIAKYRNDHHDKSKIIPMISNLRSLTELDIKFCHKSYFSLEGMDYQFIFNAISPIPKQEKHRILVISRKQKNTAITINDRDPTEIVSHSGCMEFIDLVNTSVRKFPYYLCNVYMRSKCYTTYYKTP